MQSVVFGFVCHMIVEIASVFWGVVAMASWGSSDFLVKRIIGPLGYYRVLLYTQLISLPPLFLLAVVFPPPLPSSVRTVGLITAIGVCYFLALFTLYKGLAVGKVSIITPVASTWAVVSMVLSFVFLGETLGLSQMFCTILILAGILMVSLRSSSGGQSNVGIFYALGCMFFSGLNAILLKLVSVDIGEIGTVFYSRLVVTVILLMVIPLFKSFRRDQRHKSSLKTIAGAGLSDFIGHVGFVVGVGVGIVSIVTPISGASPAVAVVLAQVFLKEKLLPIQKMAVALVILGIVLLSFVSMS